jgi:HK97 family phage prohead protease
MDYTLRRAVAGHVTKFLSTVGERQIRVIASDATPDRMGDILEPGGCQLDNFRRNPVMLAQHDANKPIGSWSSIQVKGGQLEATGEFAPEGISEIADEYCALAKAGIIRAVSVGFMPISYEPMRGGGLRFTKWDLVELSLVSVPANPNALVTERGLAGLRPASRPAPDAPLESAPATGTLEQRKVAAEYGPEAVEVRRRRVRALALRAGYKDHG